MKTFVIGWSLAVFAATGWTVILACVHQKEKPFLVPVRYVQTRSTVLYAQPGDLHIMEIQGITYLDSNDKNPYAMPLKYKRPDNPGDVTVQLWTSDGRYWHAKWVEVKP